MILMLHTLNLLNYPAFSLVVLAQSTKSYYPLYNHAALQGGVHYHLPSSIGLNRSPSYILPLHETG